MWWITCVHEARAQFSLPRSTFRQLTFSTFVGVRNIKGTSRDDAPLRAPSSLRALVPMFVRTRPYVKRFAPHNTTTTKLPKKEGCTFVGARLRRRRPGFGSASWELDPAGEVCSRCSSLALSHRLGTVCSADFSPHPLYSAMKQRKTACRIRGSPQKC